MIESRERRNIGRQLPLAALVIAILLTASIALVGITKAGSLLGGPASANQQKVTGASKVTAELAQKFAAAGPDAKLHYWVVMADQADTSNNIPNSQWAEKGWYVYNVLTKKAADTQGAVLSQIAQLTTSGSVTSYQSFWIINLVAVTGNLDSANQLSSANGVGEVRVAPTGQIYGDVQGQLSDSAYAAIDQAAKDIQESKNGSPLLAPLSPLAIQHNINEVHAPQGWALGYDGTGITVGSMDTGTRWTHEALNARYRGNVAPPDPGNIHDYNWLDGYGTFTTPTDNNGHGSHTMGTVLGTSPNATYGNTGVAKGAMWMTVRICATSSCDDIPIMNGFQWTLAPYRVNGTQPNPAYRPRVSNNSWGGSGCDTGFDTAVANWVNAGIFPDFSTGNSGPGVGTVGTPANSPGSWGTGNLATNNANWVINTSSSRGPSACDPGYPLRPFAVAPGTLICSSINTSDTSYSCGYTGTSMAAPHIAGAVAVLLSKNSSLTISQLRNAITTTAFFSPTWGTLPNNNYGYGLLQVDAALNSVSGGATPTGTPATATAIATNTAAATNTPGATPTCTAGLGTWAAGADLPSTLVRSYGAYFPTNGKFYSVGGRTGDGDPALAQLQPLEYNPATNTWVQKTAVFSDVQTSNVSGGVLTVSGTPVIAIVGGSAGGGTGGTTEMRYYNPVADTMTTVATDPWTPGTTTLPGGTAVYNNKLYVFGGFEINVGMSNQIWQYDPAAAAGSRWTLKSATLPTALGYVPAATVGSFIYTIGGSEWDGTTLIDSAVAYKYDPTADTIVAVASTPRATGETRALAIDGKVWVFGGGRVAPNPGNQVEIYDPVANTYSTGPAFTGARRNFPIATDGSKIFLAGGYDVDGTTLLSSMEIYTPGAGCGGTATPTSIAPTATNTSAPATATNTSVAGTATNTAVATGTTPSATATGTPGAGSPTATATACTLEFADVLPGNTFYANIKCLACRGIINGYPCGGDGEPCNGSNQPYFRPSNSITRGQLAKVVSQSAGYTDPVTTQTFEDVAPGTTFYDFVGRLAIHNVMGGYPCGVEPSEPCGSGNLPYFRPGANATRGQLTKIVSNAAGFSDPDPSSFTFTDVEPGSTFHLYVERLLINRPGAMNGYACGGAGEPCDSESRPYFRPSNTLTRGQTSKIISNVFFPGCETPGRPIEVSQK